MTHAMTRAVVLATLTLGLFACPAPEGPTPEEGAAHLGLVAGTTFSYFVRDGLEEQHAVNDSSILFEGESVDVIATANGFAEDKRTMSFGVDVEEASLLRYFDCIARCGAFSAPVPFVGWPLESGTAREGETTVTLTAGADTTVQVERHLTVVSGPTSVTVPAGTFDDAFLVAWTRTVVAGDGTESSDLAQLHIVPELGIVQWQDFDEATLALTAKP